jgi:DNA-binding MarR family transcriptional regulator
VDSKSGVKVAGDTRELLTTELLDILLPAMHEVRLLMRSQSGDLTVPQFRALAHIAKGVDTVTSLAQYHGVSQPTMSNIVEGLVQRGLVKRLVSAEDRRISKLQATAEGQRIRLEARKFTRGIIAKRLNGLSAGERHELLVGIRHLGRVFPSIRQAKFE